jgi:hypothetical protein
MKVNVKPTKDNFILKEVKSTDRASLELLAIGKVSEGALTNEIPYQGKGKNSYQVIPHSDLFELFDKLKERFAQYFGFHSAKVLVKSKEFGGTKAHQKYMDKHYQEVLETIKINGVSFTGKDEDGFATGLIVKGTFKGCALNTKQLHFANQEFGEEIREIADKIEDEVYSYLFEDKKSELALFDEEGTDNELPFGDDEKENSK